MSAPVIVYTSTGCPKCKEVKQALSDWGIPYEERNASEEYAYFEELQARKIFGTPATLIGGKFILGYQPEKLQKALGLTEDQAQAAAASNGEAVTAPAYTAGNASSTAAQAANGNPGDDIFESMTPALLEETYDLVVIGAGPAGASAALYAARGRMKTLVLDKAPAAGTLAITHKIANYPGVRKELTGLELVQDMQLHAKQFGARLVRTQVLSVDFSDESTKVLRVPEGTIRAKTVFIAVGAKAPAGRLPGEEEYTGRGVSYCSTCDAAFFEGRVVTVAGDNEEAIHEAEALAKFCRHVHVLLPGSDVKGTASLENLESLPNVTIHRKHRIKSIEGDDVSVSGVIVQDEFKSERPWVVDGVFLYLSGLKPGTDFLERAVQRDPEGYVVVDELLRTSVPGVFAGGDARRTPIKQAVVSAADGCIAAIGADQFVNSRTVLRPQYS